MAQEPQEVFVDVNSLPMAAVQRIEVLKMAPRPSTVRMR
jgi:hypothetical protein